MAFRASVGESDFATFRSKKTYYVDKTDIIYELVENTDNKVTLFTRPRRFGKTLMMSMMENFFSIRKDSCSIFEGLSITKHKEFCSEWMNSYPVIFISFKEAESKEFNVAYDKLKNIIADLCKKYEDLLGNSGINQADADIFNRLMFNTASDAEVQHALKTLMRILYSVYGKKVILLIDEYDVPLAKASENGYYDKMLDVVRGIMSSSLKDNEFLQFAVITGCLRIAKESIFTGTNNFKTYSVLDKRFSSYFGFSSQEVETMLESADRVDKSGLIKEWYDGYLFGDSYLYCPWDVVNYLSDLQEDVDAQPLNYWKNTSSNDILLSFAKRTDFSVSKRFETLLNGGVIRQSISDTITYDSLHSSEDNLWSVLLMTGYLTRGDPKERTDIVTLRIPNKEIASIFEDTVVTLFEHTIDTTRQRSMMEAFWSGDENEVSKLMSDFLWDTISYHDYHEDYYHAFLTGIFVGLGYDVDSNKETGLGRVDIQLVDKKNRRALIIEAKKSGSESSMESDCNKAADQIKTRKYYEDLDGYNTILCYGVFFYKKQAKVKLICRN